MRSGLAAGIWRSRRERETSKTSPVPEGSSHGEVEGLLALAYGRCARELFWNIHRKKAGTYEGAELHEGMGAGSRKRTAFCRKRHSGNGVLIIDKPEGITSFDVVYRLRRLTGQRKIGHTGTLDPMATGVLPLLLGKAARAESLLPETWKEYEAGFRLGEETDTEDSTGKLLSQCERAVSREELEKALESFRGDILQVPPMYSALKRDGKKLYELARQGIVVEREPRPVTVYELELLEYGKAGREGRLRIRCSAGTYVRTLCADLGKALGVGGIMISLRRTAACGFSKKEALTLEEASALQKEGLLSGRILPVEYLFREFSSLRVTEAQAKRFCNGGELDLHRTTLSGKQFTGEERFRVLGPGGFLGLGKVDLDAGSLKVLKLF